jgi:hypothetical protein
MEAKHPLFAFLAEQTDFYIDTEVLTYGEDMIRPVFD